VKTLNISQAKLHLSRAVEQAEDGEIIVITRRKVPVAILSAFQAEAPKEIHRTKIGWAKGSGARILGDLTEPVLPATNRNPASFPYCSE
jgi:antitoxin (DNA-binding transcriptional repressor) of toxin-antitoxin stability system